MFKIYFLHDGVELPQEGTYYVVAKNGVFLRKDTGLVVALVKVEQISFLRELQPQATLKLPRLEPRQLAQVVGFFRWVSLTYNTEAVILLHYSPGEQKYRLCCPGQLVSSGEVTYNSSKRFPDFQLVGTIHSHNHMKADHSCVDEENEKHFDGIHVTIGNLDEQCFDIACSIVVNNNRFPVDPQAVFDGLEKVNRSQPLLQFLRKNLWLTSVSGEEQTLYRLPRHLEQNFPLEWRAQVAKQPWSLKLLGWKGR